MSSGSLIWVLAGGTVALCALIVLLWALFSDRSRGRRRCPKCWYSMEAAPSLRCPECGFVAKRERHLYRTRRRWKLAFVAVPLLMLAVYLAIQPKVRPYGYGSLTPVTVLIFLFQFDDSEWIVRGIDYQAERDLFHRPRASSLVDPLDPGFGEAMWSWQWRWLGHTTLRRIKEQEPVRKTHWRYQYWLALSREFGGDDHLSARITQHFLEEMTHDKPWVRRMAVARSIDGVAIDESVHRFRDLLDDESADVRAGVLNGMLTIASRNTRGVELLIEALKHERADVREQSLVKLCMLTSQGIDMPGAYEAVAAMHDDPDCDVRSARFCPLAWLHGTDAAWNTISDAMGSTDSCTRTGGILAALHRTFNGAEVVWQERPPEIVRLLVGALDDEDPDVRIAAASGLRSFAIHQRDDLMQYVDDLETIRREGEEGQVTMRVDMALRDLQR